MNPETGKSAEWESGIQGVVDEAQGVYTISVIRPHEAAAMLIAARGGNLDALRLASGVSNAVHHVEAAPRTKRPLCGCCPRRVRPGNTYAVGVVYAKINDPTACFSFVLCARCMGGDDYRENAMKAVRRLISDARIINIQDQPGHA